MTDPKFWLVVPAAGVGRRMGADCPKQYLPLNGHTVLDVTLSRLLSQATFDGCMVPICADDTWWAHTDAARDARITPCAGGRERADSVLSALNALDGRAAPDDWVLVHDAARPCLHGDDLSRLMANLRDHPVGGLLAAPVADTLKRSGPDGVPEVLATVDRSGLWRALTPQMFRYRLLRRALADALATGNLITDEASAIEQAGYRPLLVEGRPDNLKITVPSDLALARFILSQG